MVAYSFAPQFRDAVASLRKLQTVRGNRARHARPGEPIQLYTAMRTKYCRKLVQVDPICVDVRQIEINIAPRNPLMIRDIAIEGVPLTDDQIAAFAFADGFGLAPDACARRLMGLFWLKAHPGVLGFDGVVIRWEPQA